MGCEKIINLQKEGGENILNLEREMNVGGAVKSVNGMTGDVVLTTSDLENTSDYQTGSEVESAISTAVESEATIRANADTALGGRIDNLVTGLGNEITARQTADNSLQGQIDAITASSDVTDIVGTKAQLNNYDTSKLNDNDIIKVLQDESQNDETTYYRWSTATQSFSLIGEEGPYYTKAESNVLLQAKQDILTAGANIDITNNVISATDTTYTAGNAITIDANNEISADIYPADYFTAEATMTETGTTIQFDGTIPANIIFDNLYGDTFQQTYTGKNKIGLTPYYTGANIYNRDPGEVFPNTTSSSVVISSQTNSSITFNSTASNAGILEVSGPLIEGETYTLSASLTASGSIRTTVYALNSSHEIVRRIGNTTSSSLETTMTMQSGELYIAYAARGNENNYIFTIDNLQLEVGSKATSFEPFVGGVPAPNPEYPQDVHTVTGEQTVTIVSKNLFTFGIGTGVFQGITWTRSGNIATGQGKATSNYTDTASRVLLPQPLKAGETYTFSLKEPIEYAITLYLFDKNQSVITPSVNIPIGSTTATFSKRADAYYARISIGGLTVGQTINLSLQAQIEAGSTATDYQLNHSQSYTIDLGTTELCKIGDYQDYIYKSGDDWYLHKVCGKYTFTGSENWVSSAYGTNSWNLSNLLNFPFDSNKLQILSEVFRGIASKDRGTAGNNLIYTAGNALFEIRNTTLTTLAGVQSATSGTPIYYALATPTDTKITDSSLISQLDTLDTAHSYNGETNIVVTATGTNLPAIAKVTVINNSASGIVKVLENAVTSAQLDSRLGGLTLLPISQTDYDALSTKDPNTLYVITGA